MACSLLSTCIQQLDFQIFLVKVHIRHKMPFLTMKYLVYIAAFVSVISKIVSSCQTFYTAHKKLFSMLPLDEESYAKRSFIIFDDVRL